MVAVWRGEEWPKKVPLIFFLKRIEERYSQTPTRREGAVKDSLPQSNIPEISTGPNSSVSHSHGHCMFQRCSVCANEDPVTIPYC